MKSKMILAAILFSLWMSGTVFAETSVKEYHWDDKLARGFLNIVSSPVEVARLIQMTSNESSMLEGWTVGLAKGLGYGVMRLGAGVIDVLTCPFNFPDSEKKPLIEPEFVWEKPGVKYTS